MPNVGQVEDAIERVEGFRVRLRYLHGRDVRSDRQRLPKYKYERALKGNATVRRWKEVRFRPNYSGWDVEVLDPKGKALHGGYFLSTVRGMHDGN